MDNSELHFEPELVCKLKLALKKAGFTDELIDRLFEAGRLELIREFLLGQKEICPLESVIELGVEPLPDGKLTVYKHEKWKSWRFVPGQIKLYRSPLQVEGKSIRGERLLGERGIKNQCLGNACLFDWFRKHRERIPVPADLNSTVVGNRRLCFPGTTYRNGDSHLGVRCMTQLGQEWIFTQFMVLKELWSPNDFVVYIDPPVSR